MNPRDSLALRFLGRATNAAAHSLILGPLLRDWREAECLDGSRLAHGLGLLGRALSRSAHILDAAGGWLRGSMAAAFPGRAWAAVLPVLEGSAVYRISRWLTLELSRGGKTH